MARVRILIVEDELLVAEEMAAVLKTNGYDVLDIVNTVIDAKRALEVYKIDILLVDIRLKGEEDGITLAAFVKEQYALPLIFTTSLFDKTTIDRAVLTTPSAYLVKPYNYHELQIAIEMALFNFEHQQAAQPNSTITLEDSHYLVNQHVFIKDKNRFERVEFSDIMWLKAESSYVNVHTNKKNYLLTSDTLGSFLDKIDLNNLLRIHRSYAVNIDKVIALEGNEIHLPSQTIPVGKNYRAAVKQHFNIW